VDVIRKVLQLLSARERRQAYLLVVMILLMGIFDAVGVASVMPFIAVLADPAAAVQTRYLNFAYVALGFASTEQFLFFLGVAVFLTLLLSIAFRATTTWALLRFTHMREYTLGRKLVASYLHQPYETFLNRHSSDLGKSVLAEVQEVVVSALIPLMQLIAHGAVAAALLALLIAVDPLLALYVALGLGIGYGGIYLILRRWLKRIGAERAEARRIQFKTLAEAFGGIKEVKVGLLEEAMIRQYEVPARRFARNVTSAQLAKQMPRYLLEVFAFGGMLLVVLYLMRNTGLQRALPIIALYALVSYRLMPAIQQVYAQLSTLRFAGPALDAIHAELSTLRTAPLNRPAAAPVPLLEREIRLADVVYAYPGSARKVLRGIDLAIAAGSTVGLVGATGSGKTTTVDIILGLLTPQSGALSVDGMVITAENMRSWQRCVGYVPQNTYLCDDTIASNIAFGVRRDRIDRAAVEQAARIANLHDFVASELPSGYETLVGERGVRLSGGQRQRIGIARALYHRPRVLILDEATSALDTLTEQSVMEAVHNLGDDITVILIAHRLTTVQPCDRIYFLEKGRVAAQGRFDELMNLSPRFREMAQVASPA